MAILTQACLEQLKRKVDLVDLLSSYLELKRAGAYFRGLCPFHDEKSPSFVVQAGASHYHCFGCQAHGDAIAFLMQNQQLSFNEAVETLAERYQVPLEYESQKELGFNKGRLLEVLYTAHNYFHDYLMNNPEGKEALAYLTKRGLNLEFLKTYEIGLAPQNSSLFLKAMYEKKVSNQELKDVGLLNDRGSSFFFNRIMFPIRDPRGSVIAFSARLYKEGTGGGKYINSKETLLFKKSYVLFGLNYSRMRLAKGKKVLLVEGQIDALRLIHEGLNATVAPLGTALTESHVDKLLQLGIESAYLAFDSDEAGINAAIKTGNLLQKKGISTQVVIMPEGADPDSVLKEKGVEGFRELLKTRRDYLAFLVETSSKRVDFSDPANKARVVEKIVSEIKKWEHPILVYESLKRLAELTQIPESTLGVEGISIPHIHTTRPTVEKTGGTPDHFFESDLLSWLLHSDLDSKKSLKIAHQNLSCDQFQDPSCKLIYGALVEMVQDQKAIDTLSLLSKFTDETTQKLFSKLLEKKIDQEKFQTQFVEAIQRLLDHNWMKKREEIKVKIQSGTLSDQEAMELGREFSEIQKNRPQVHVPSDSV